MSDEMAARRNKLLAVAGGGQSISEQLALMMALTESQATTTAAHQALRALQKDYLAALDADEKRDDARLDAWIAKVDALNARLLESETARAKAEGELAAMRSAFAAESQRAITIQMPPETESAPVGYTMRVVRDGANQIRDVKLIPEEGSND